MLILAYCMLVVCLLEAVLICYIFVHLNGSVSESCAVHVPLSLHAGHGDCCDQGYGAECLVICITCPQSSLYVCNTKAIHVGSC